MLAFALAASPAAAVTCVSGTVSSITVTSGQTVELCGHVNGAVIVGAGGSFTSDSGSSIGGAVTAQPGALLLDLEGTRVGGPVTATSVAGNGASPPHAVTLCGSTINGAVRVSNAGALVTIGKGTSCGNTINGAISATNNAHGLDVAENTVSGAVTLTGNSFSDEDFPTACTVPSSDCGNEIEVGGNTISGSLVCTGNPFGVFRESGSSYFSGEAPNVVHGATTGQCVNEASHK
jgi:hypothetical protein